MTNGPDDLFARAQSGDSEALEALMLANDRLVHSVAKKWLRGDVVHYDDMLQEGRIGLMKAIQHFKPELGYAFSTYAVPKIRNEVARSFGRHANLIWIPEYTTARHRKIRRFASDFLRENKREATPEEIGKHFGWPPEAVKVYVAADGYVLELDRIQPNDVRLATYPAPDDYSFENYDKARTELAALVALSAESQINGNRLTDDEQEILAYYLRVKDYAQVYRLYACLPPTAVIPRDKRRKIEGTIRRIEEKLRRVAAEFGVTSDG